MMSFIPDKWHAFSKWYDGLVWWKKALLLVPLILLAVLGLIAYFLSGEKPKKTDADKVIGDGLKDDTKKYVSEKKRLEEELKAKKIVEISLINQTTAIDKKAVDTRNAIRDAKSIEEIDAILKGIK